MKEKLRLIQKLMCFLIVFLVCMYCNSTGVHAADATPPQSSFDASDGGTTTDDGRYYIFKYHLALLNYDAPTGTAVYRLTQSFSIREGNVNVMTDSIVLTNRNGARQPVGSFSSHNGSRSPGDYTRTEFYDITLTEGENKIIAEGSYTDGSGDAEFLINVNKFNSVPTVTGTDGTWMEGEVAKGTRTWQSVYTDGATGSEEGNKKQTSTGFMYYDVEEAPSGINAYGYNANNTTYDGNNAIYKNSGITGIYNSSGNVVNWTELNNPGTYTVYSHTTDSGANKGTGSRKITVKENKKPVITAPNRTFYEGEHTAAYWTGTLRMSGVSATDNEDGPIASSKIKIKSDNVNVGKAGTYQVVYEVSDSMGKVGTATSTVTVKTNHAPVITAPNRSFYEGEHTTAYWTGTLRMSGVSATDAEDGPIASSKIKIKSDNVKVGTPGTYQVIYEVADKFGKVGTATSTVTVKYNNPPVLTASNQTFYEAQYTQSHWRNTLKYTGMSATDTEDGNLTSKVSIEENVNVMKPGAYPVKYSVTDAYGKTTSKTVTITIKYNNPPVITASNQSFYENQYDRDQWKKELLMKDVSAKDTEDGDLTSKISVIQDDVDPKTPGTYPVIYSVSDKWGKGSMKEVKVTVKYNNPPVISADDQTYYEDEKTQEAWEETLRMKGVSAIDKEDGNITDDIEIIEDSVIMDTAGVYKVIYRVSDQWGKGVKKEVKVTIKYNNPPEINASNQTYYENEITQEEWEKTLRMKDVCATDSEDGNITSKLKITKDSVNFKIPGIYPVTYQVTDRFGKTTEKTITVHIKYNHPPVIDAESLVFHEGEYTDAELLEQLKSAEANDLEDGEISNSIQIIKNDVDPKVPGSYEVTYEVKDALGKITIKTIDVTVIENQRPTLQIFATSKRFIEGEYSQDEWDELRMNDVTAHDREDTDLTDQIEILEDKTDPGIAGNYTITYTVTDRWGKSIQKTANVTVEPNQAPIIYANDKWYKVTDSVTEKEILKDVYAFDDHDGELTNQVEIASNEVVSGVAGEYKVTYKVQDRFGKMTAKNVMIYIQESGSNPTPPLPPIITDPDALSLFNGRQLAKIDITKLMEDSIFYLDNANAYHNVVFGIFAADDILYKDQAVLEKDSMVGITHIDDAGHINAILYHKGRYYLQELATDDNYVLPADHKYYFNFE